MQNAVPNPYVNPYKLTYIIIYGMKYNGDKKKIVTHILSAILTHPFLKNKNKNKIAIDNVERYIDITIAHIILLSGYDI